MKKFIVKSLSFSLVLVAATMLLALQKKDHSNVSDYMAAIEDKHNRLKNTPSPRIVLIGGSNLSFGMNSRELSKATGIPVVNMGLHGGLGLEFILQEVREEISERDFLVISNEYFLDPTGDYKLKQLTRSFYPESSKYFEANLYKDLKGSLGRAQNNFRYIFMGQTEEIDENSVFGSVYRRRSFNESGDVLAHLDYRYSEDIELKDKKVIEYKYWKGIGMLQNFCIEASGKGASVYYSFPPFPRSEWVKYGVSLRQLEGDLRRDAPCLNFLNTTKDGVLDDKYFFDTVYHLAREGRAIRTKALIDDLMAAGINRADRK